MHAWLPSGTRVAVAMSGGVDSSVAAALLQEAGCDVLGVTMTLWSCHRSARAVKQTCCSTADVADARAVCERLGIPHCVVDFRSEFRERVIDHFAAEYAQARTPIPCIGCNQHFKFDRLWDVVQREHGAVYLATGHYAQIARDVAGAPLSLCRGRDAKKDQTYYLFVMTRAQLQHSLFPLGALTKTEVRAHAQRLGLVTAEKPESFEICFVPDNDYAGFLEDYYPHATGRPGAFLDTEGAVLGQHRGTHAYTIGQRRGLGVSGSERRYVTAIDPLLATVTLGTAAEVLGTRLSANGVNWICPQPAAGETLRATAKIRAQHTPASCRVTVDGVETLHVEFDTPQSAITPGQAVVLYDGDVVLGGGWIEKSA
ncbi:MAG: tRNA 2-thiouridine(34) synthase MnmA [Deltaproteobacteria bacterium]|nr:tRNA 2-thiouridine(34) synthase MnmA [Deltaproteobacteria bacterium]